MMKLTSYIDNCLDMALAQGLSSSNNVVLRVKQDVSVILSHAEPDQLIFPDNGIWIVSDASSGSYKQALRRTSRNPSGGNTFTWSEVSTFDLLMEPQVWNDIDLPEPVLISGVGGTLEGSLVPHEGPYVEAEVVPKSVVTSEVAKLRSNFFTMFQNMNNRVLSVDGRMRSAETNISALGARIDAVEAFESSLTSKAYVIGSPSETWYLRHNAASSLAYILCLTESGEILCPDTVVPDETDPENVTAVSFSSSVSGLAFALLFQLTEEVHDLNTVPKHKRLS